LNESKDSIKNWSKEKDDQLLALVKEYLQKSGYNRAFETLKHEKPIRRVNTSTSNHKSDEESKVNAAIKAFDKGER